MDRDLRIRMLLEAGDRATRPLRDIAAGGTKAAEALRATRDRLKAINRAQVDVAAFRQLKAGARSTEQAMQAASTRVGQLTREMAQADRPTRAMTRDLAAARTEAARLTRQHDGETRQLQELRDRLRAAGVETTSLARDERDLRRAAESTTRELEEQSRRAEQLADRQRRAGAARASFGRVQGMAGNMAASGAAAIGTGVALGTGVWAGVKAAQEYQSVMTDIAQKADLPRAKAVQLGKELLVAAKAANQLPDAMQAGVDGLAGLGASIPNAVAMMTPIGRAATAYKAEVADLSAAAFAATDNLKVPVRETQRVIDVMATAGKAGAFEIKDMAQYFPALTAAYQGLGQAGTGAVADLAAGLQIARKGAGDAASAGTNLSNVLQKIASPATNRAFAKMGVDLPAALKKAYAEGKTPLEAIAELTNKTLKGDLSKLGYLFEDAQVQQGLRPLIQNLDEFRRIRAQALAGDGTTGRDFAERMNDSAEQTKKLRINGMALAIGLGSTLLPTVNAVTQRLASFANWIAGVAERHPMMAKAVAVGAAALAGLFVVLGGGAIAIAGILGPFALLSAVATYTGMAMLPIIGIAAGVVLGIAAIAAGAYLIYANWGAVSAWFSGLWSGIKATVSGAADAVVGVFGSMWTGVKALFSIGTLDIYRGIAWLIGYGLGALARFGTAAVGWLTGTLPGLLASGFSTAWAALAGAIGAAGTWLTTRLPQILGNAWTVAWGAFRSAVQAAFVTLPALFFNFGTMILQGLWNGIKSAPARLVAAGKALAGSLASGFRKGADIHSPSRVFMALGGHIVAGLDRGLARDEAAPVERLTRLTRAMAAANAVPLVAGAAFAAPRAAAETVDTLARASADIRVVAPRPIASPARAERDGFGGAARSAALPATPTYTITVNAAPGMDEAALARAVAAELDRRERRAAADRRSTYRDDPDGADV